ncbi:MAG: MoaD/ThiS family protein [Actinomycetota bacterium]|jgi:sulfur carrier protein ThiS|nr:MoaD/ThiS family protein [Actinomycetota bacterium]
MKVDIALFASLSGFHAQDGKGHTRHYDLAPGTVIADVIAMLGLPDQPRIVFVGGRHAEETAELHEGERLAIFPPVAGG